MENTEEELRFRGKEEEVVQEETKPVVDEKEEEEIKKAIPIIKKEEKDPNYNVEKDPRYRCLFIMLKVIIVILSLISFAIIFFNWIAPHLVPTEHKINYLREHLMATMCEEECTEKDYADIENIIKRVRSEM